jgi:thymidylate synthase
MAQEYFSSESICGINAAMEFIPLHFADRLTIINPQGTIGVVTLWSKVEYVMERFRQAGVDLTEENSHIAVFGTLYGNGLREMLRNLLYNPQIQTLLICGHDRSGSREDLVKFFELGLEAVDSSLVRYKSSVSDTVVAPCRIRKTKRIMDDLVKPEIFQRTPNIIWLGDPQNKETPLHIRDFIKLDFPPIAEKEFQRQHVPLPEIEVQFLPSNPRAHQVVSETPLEAWKEILYRLSRFGRRVTLKKGDRLELQNIKAVIEKPEFEDKANLRACNFDTKKLKRYQEDIIHVIYTIEEISSKGQLSLPLEDMPRYELRADETYSYGHRLRQHFKIDGLDACVTRLKNDPQDRKAYFTLWDNKKDLVEDIEKGGHPCFVSLFFRKFEEKLTLTATFRTHNAIDGWLLNCYGLMAIQKWVADKIRMPIGAITVVSHSISIDPRELDRALLIIGKRPFKVNLDPMGYFRITLDSKEILVEHRFEDVTLKEYRGKKAERLQHEIARDVAVSDINHAIYLGRQLAKAEMALKDGREFVQD